MIEQASTSHLCQDRLQQLLHVVPSFSQQTERDVSWNVKAIVKGVFVASVLIFYCFSVDFLFFYLSTAFLNAI